MSPPTTFSLFPVVETYPKVPIPQAYPNRSIPQNGTQEDSSATSHASAATIPVMIEPDQVPTFSKPEHRERRFVAIPAPSRSSVSLAAAGAISAPVPVPVPSIGAHEELEQDTLASLRSFSSSPPRAVSRNSHASSIPGTRRSSITLVASECPSRTNTIRRKASSDDTSTLKGDTESSIAGKSKARPAALRSIFPEYDEELPLNQQHYFPTQISPRNLQWDQVAKQSYSPDFGLNPYSDAEDTAAKAPSPELDEVASSSYTPEYELPKLWELMQGAPLDATVPQSFRLKMHRPPPPTKAELKMRSSKRRGAKCEKVLSFGPSHARAYLTVSTDTEDVEKDKQGNPQARVQLTRCDPTFLYHPGTKIEDITVPITDFCVASKPDESNSKPSEASPQNDGDKEVTTITPHNAIVSALATAANSAEGVHLANVDPMANTMASVRLAESAMAKARAENGSKLVFTISAGGSRTGRWAYAMRSPQLGLLPIEIDGDVRLDTTADSAQPVRGGSIRLMAPSSTSSSMSNFSRNSVYKQRPLSPSSSSSSLHSSGFASSSRSRELASLCVATCTLTINISALAGLANDNTSGLTLQAALDMAVSSLVAVLLTESFTPRLSTLLTFQPPPSAGTGKRSNSPKRSFAGIRLRKSKSSNVGESKGSDEGKLEAGMGTAFGAVAFILGMAVDGLAGVVDNVERKRQASGQAQAASLAPGMAGTTAAPQMFFAPPPGSAAVSVVGSPVPGVQHGGQGLGLFQSLHHGFSKV